MDNILIKGPVVVKAPTGYYFLVDGSEVTEMTVAPGDEIVLHRAGIPPAPQFTLRGTV